MGPKLDTRVESLEIKMKRLPSIGELQSEVRSEMQSFTQRIETLLLQQRAELLATHPVGEGSGLRRPNPLASGVLSVDLNDSPTLPYRSGPEVRKIKMQTCDGEELVVWLNQAEQYFALHEMSEILKLRAARICLI